jgi:hypothetical protein
MNDHSKQLCIANMQRTAIITENDGTKRKTNFFSLPQILHQKILYESLPEETLRRLAQMMLRMFQECA